MIKGKYANLCLRMPPRDLDSILGFLLEVLKKHFFSQLMRKIRFWVAMLEVRGLEYSPCVEIVGKKKTTLFLECHWRRYFHWCKFGKKRFCHQQFLGARQVVGCS